MTASTDRTRLTTGARFFIGAATLLALVNVANFAFYGREWHSLVSAVGFALMAYGTYRGGGPNTRAADGRLVVDRKARMLLILGMVLALAGMVARHMG
ncbi:hypothetical protein [Coralloluteibacterium thermophilus]|uniref:DUF2892 domain-containing protein n=1 Tax=Coralloluteibacterium thermophilum TaxID=2707049 RepID=A0ABV9NNK4_9GAMM